MSEPRAIIVDGPDGSGKTVLSDRLKEDFHLGYSHEKGDLPHIKDDDLLPHYLNLIRSGGVIDRSILSEMVFGPLLRKKLRTDDIGAVMAELEKQKGFYIVCLPPPENCMIHWADRQKKGEEFINDPQEFMWSYARFSYLARVHLHYFRFIVFDYTQHSYEGLLNLMDL